MELTLKLTEQEVSGMLKIVGASSFNDVAAFIFKVQEQCRPQIEALTPNLVPASDREQEGKHNDKVQ